jgi:hypothetical protein
MINLAKNNLYSQQRQEFIKKRYDEIYAHELAHKNVAGAFYLTEDTNRLYIGKTIDGKVVPVPVNQGVVYVANIDALPSGDAATAVKTGEFYYAEAENILCVRSAGKWIQINKYFCVITINFYFL